MAGLMRVAFVVMGSFLLFGLAGCPQGAFEVAVTRDVVYGTGNVSTGGQNPVFTTKELLLDVYEPAAKGGGRAAVVMAHGGSFTEGDKRKEELVRIAENLAQNAYVCFSIDYRLTTDNPPAPAGWTVLPFGVNLANTMHASFVDMKAAIRYVRANAEEYGVDPNRVAALGESAGAFAALTASLSDSGEFASDGAAFPIPTSDNPGVNDKADACVDLWGNGDHLLLEIDSFDPPMMIVHGEEDDNLFTPFGAAQRLNVLSDLLGIPHEFYPIQDGGHGVWDARVDRKNLRRLILEFLNEYL